MIMTKSPLMISIDADYIHAIVKDEIEKIMKSESNGTWWDLKRLEQETCRKRGWLMENIILNPDYREQMNVISNKESGNPWLFNGQEMKKFLEINFPKLTKGAKK